MSEYNTVQEYFEHQENYLKDDSVENDMGLSVNPKILELALNVHGNNPDGCDFFPIKGSIRPNENITGNEPDCDAMHDLASSYCFGR